MREGSYVSSSSDCFVTVHGSYVPTVCRHASSVHVEDKTFVYDERLHTMMVLNPPAAAILSGCDGERTVERLAEDLSTAFAEDLTRIRSDVMATVAKLADLGLVEDRDPSGGGGPRSRS
jgi:Coenzyme PQQ synthesis protein D (PqqD)